MSFSVKKFGSAAMPSPATAAAARAIPLSAWNGVRELRAAKEMTLQELSIGTKLSVGYLSQVERGLSVPSVSALQTIAKALDVTVSWFGGKRGKRKRLHSARAGAPQTAI